MTEKKTRLNPIGGEKRHADAGQICEQAIRKVQLAHRWRAADGRSAFGALNRAAYGDKKGRDPRKLSIEDASILASRLHAFLQEVAPRLKELGVSRGELCRRSGLCGRTVRNSADTLPEDAKELYRLTLPPGADARKRGIRVGALKYMNLIEKLVDVLGDNVEQVADRLLRGTSLHPMSKSEDQWSDMDLVQAHLQRIVNDVDRDFDLLKTYRWTAELKCRWIAEGGQLSWPLYDFSDLYSDGQSAEEVEAFRKERTVAADPNQAFYRRQMHFGRRLDGEWWLYGFEQGALQHDEFFYVPHAPLGHVLMWDLPDRREDRFAYELALQQQLQQRRSASSSLALPIDEWDNARACPTGQTAERTGNAHLQEFFWLLAYPHPDGKRIVPTLYQAGEEGGAYMVPLDMEVMDTLSDAVWVSVEKHCSLFDRLTELLTEVGDDGLNPIERNMRRTAAWLHDNPILKQHREREDRSHRLSELFRTAS